MAMKRPASSSAGASYKKIHADDAAVKCRAVAAAIKESGTLSSECKGMVAAMLSSSLLVYATERHAFQTKAVKMAGDALSIVSGEKKAAVSEMQSKVDGSDAEKANRTAVVESAKAALDSLLATESAAKAVATADKEAYSSAVEAHATAKKNKADTAKEVASVADQLKTLEEALKEKFEPFKEAKAGARQTAALAKVLTDICGADENLAKSVQETLKKDKEARGTFDTVVMGQVEEELTKNIKSTQATAATSEPKTAACEAAVTAAEATEAAALAKKDASAAALSEATAAKKVGEDALKVAEKAVANFEPEIAQAASDLADAKEDLEAFETNAIAAFAYLKEYAPPPEPVPEPEPVVEEPAIAEPEVAAEPAVVG